MRRLTPPRCVPLFPPRARDNRRLVAPPTCTSWTRGSLIWRTPIHASRRPATCHHPTVAALPSDQPACRAFVMKPSRLFKPSFLSSISQTGSSQFIRPGWTRGIRKSDAALQSTVVSVVESLPTLPPPYPPSSSVMPHVFTQSTVLTLGAHHVEQCAIATGAVGARSGTATSASQVDIEAEPPYHPSVVEALHSGSRHGREARSGSAVEKRGPNAREICASTTALRPCN